MADSPSSGYPECAALPVGREAHAKTAARGGAKPKVGGLAVDQVPRLRRDGVGGLRAVAAPLFARHEHEADARLALRAQPFGGRHLRREDALGVARAAPVEHARPRRGSGRTAARSRSAWRTRPPARPPRRSRWRGRRRAAVRAPSSRGPAGCPPARRATSPSRPVVESMSISCRARATDRRSRLPTPDSRPLHRIHASSSVRVSVRSSRYFTITGVASDRPHSRAGAHGDGPRAGHDDRALGHHQRLARFRLDDHARSPGRRPAWSR